MLRCFLVVVLVMAASGGEPRFELSGDVAPAGRVAISLYGATRPFTTGAVTLGHGHFRFRKLRSGTYTVAVLVPGRGEVRRTVEVGPGTADAKRRVALTVQLKDADFEAGALSTSHRVSAAQLAVPPKALREYGEAQKRLARPDVEGAVQRLERAVKLAPQFSVAWNELGTIAYQQRNFLRAEECFREALAQGPDSFEPLVNLGGLLIAVRQFDEAIDRNLHAVLARPNDALANSQLGLTYFELGRFDLAQKYLERARQIDPAHFSHPQLVLAEIHLRQHEPRAAADDLEDFLKHHPDFPTAAKMREKMAEFRK